MKKIHNPPELLQGPTYSQGIEVPAGGRTLYVAGQVGWDREGKAPAGIAAQTKLAIENLRTVLRSAGMDLEDIVKMTVFMVNPADFPEFSKVRSGIFGTVKPASTLVFIKQLVKPELLLEIEAVAVGN